MKLSKDKLEIRYHGFLTLRGIPAAASGYRLGERSGIVNDPNRDDDPQYILRLIGQVITVSLETKPSSPPYSP